MMNTVSEGESSAVKVAVRIRPLNEKEARESTGINVVDNSVVITNPEDKDKKTFTYDFVYNSDTTQKNVYDDIGSQIIANAYKGYNCCVFAYGQTGSGKSYSMLGDANEHAGLIPRICESLFEQQTGADKTSYRMELSYMEIYSEQVKDLINPDIDSESLKVRQHPEYGPYVEGLTQIPVENFSTIKKIITKGNNQRHIASTLMNLRSSRSHAILTIYFTQITYEADVDKTREIVSKINLVDLAGSERTGRSGVVGVNFQEAVMINKSLSTLGLVIQKLADQSNKNKNKKIRTVLNQKKKTMGSLKNYKSEVNVNSPKQMTNQLKKMNKVCYSPSRIPTPNHKKVKKVVKDHIPFRDSVLTWVLKESLGGNSKTYMIATVSPASINYFESLSTLRYASNTKNIINSVRVNEDPNTKIINVLREEINALKAQLQTGGGKGAPVDNSLLEDLAQREALMREKEKSWEDKLKESRRISFEAQKRLKEELLAKQADYKLKLQAMDAEMHELKMSISEKEMNKQTEMDEKLTRTKQEYEKRQYEFEKEKIVETAVSLQEYYEKRLVDVQKHYEEQLKLKEEAYNKASLDEIDRLRGYNKDLKENLNKNQRDLHVQMRRFANERAVLSKQIQQYQSKIYKLEQDIRASALEKSRSDNMSHEERQLMETEIANKTEEYNLIKLKCDEEEKKYDALQNSAQILMRRIETNKEHLITLDLQHSKIVSQIEQNSKQLTDLKMEYKTLQMRFEADRDEYDELLVEKEELHTEITHLKVAMDIHVSNAHEKIKNPTVENLLQIRNGFDEIFNNIRSISLDD